jgi:hypothetical protein
MAAIVRAAQATNSGSSAVTTFTPALPSGVSAPAAGDLLLAVACGSLAATPTATPSGWTLVRNIADTTFHMSIYRKIAAGGDANPSWTATSRKWAGATLVVGAGTFDATTPIDAENGVAVGTTATTALATPSVTTVTDGCLLVAIFGNLGASTYTTTNTNPSMLEATDTTASGTSPASCAMYHSGTNSVAVGSYVRNATATVSSANGAQWLGAIRPGTAPLVGGKGQPIGTRRMRAAQRAATW